MVARMRYTLPTENTDGSIGNGDFVLTEASPGDTNPAAQSGRKKNASWGAQVVIWWILLVSGGVGSWLLWSSHGSALGVSWAWMDGIVPSSFTTTGSAILLADPDLPESEEGSSGSAVGKPTSVSESDPNENSIILRDEIPIKKAFSFCLLIKDDNAILNEWIAYHYYTLHMRTLIVTIDPSSKTTPVPLLEVWKQEFGLNYEIWNDSNFTEPWFYVKKKYHRVPRQVKKEDRDAEKWQEEGADVSSEQRKKDVRAINVHRYRQKRFLHRCEQYLQEEGYSWMAHIDTDEYIVVSPAKRNRTLVKKKVKMNESDIIYQFLEQVKTYELLDYPCLTLPRVLYGSVEDPDSPSKSYEAEQMETLRWKYRTGFDNKVLKQPKVIMDVSGVPRIQDYKMLNKRAFSIHRPDFGLCRAQGQMNVLNWQRFPFTINHYLGSLKRYMARNDTRRTQTVGFDLPLFAAIARLLSDDPVFTFDDSQQYNKMANVQDGKDDEWIDAWWPGFLRKFGEEKVMKVMGRYMDPSVYGAETKAALVQLEQQSFTPPTFDSPDKDLETQKSPADS